MAADDFRFFLISQRFQDFRALFRMILTQTHNIMNQTADADQFQIEVKAVLIQPVRNNNRRIAYRTAVQFNMLRSLIFPKQCVAFFF